MSYMVRCDRCGITVPMEPGDSHHDWPKIPDTWQVIVTKDQTNFAPTNMFHVCPACIRDAQSFFHFNAAQT